MASVVVSSVKVVDADVDELMILASRYNSSLDIAWSSVAWTMMLATAESVAPLEGDVIFTMGAVVSGSMLATRTSGTNTAELFPAASKACASRV